MRTMSTWDHGEQLLYDSLLERKKNQNSQKLSRLILKNNLSDAKKLIGDICVSSNEPDPDDYGRSAVTYAAMYSSPKTVEFLLMTGATATKNDELAALKNGKNKNAQLLQTWPQKFHDNLNKQQQTSLLEYEQATILRAQEANAKHALHFLRNFLRIGRVRHGHRYEKKLISSFHHLEKCPLGNPDDFVELGRILRTLLPEAWNDTSEVWNAFQNATIAARSKYNMTQTFGGKVGGGTILFKLAQQGNQGEVFKAPGQQNWLGKSVLRSSRSPPPPPPRDYSCLISGPRYDKEVLPGI